jgi:hypothetical protein
MSKKVTNFSKFSQVTADDIKVISKAKSGSYGISVVNTESNGVRVSFTKALHEALDSPEEIQFVTNGDYLYVGAKIPYATESIPFSSGKGKNVIYHRGFVDFLTNHFQLDFSKRTSLSFRDVRIKTQEFEEEEIVFAKIKMAQ